MKKNFYLSAFAIIALFLVGQLFFALAIPGNSVSQENDVWIPIHGGKYFIEPNQTTFNLIIDQFKFPPLLNDRYVMYGHYVREKGAIDTTHENKLTKTGLNLHRRISTIPTPSGAMAVFTVVMTYSNMRINKYDSVPWDWLLPKIEAALKEELKVESP